MDDEAHGNRQDEMMMNFLKYHKIFVCDRVEEPTRLKSPIYVKGNQMPGQPFGCLRLPSHGRG